MADVMEAAISAKDILDAAFTEGAPSASRVISSAREVLHYALDHLNEPPGDAK